MRVQSWEELGESGSCGRNTRALSRTLVPESVKADLRCRSWRLESSEASASIRAEGRAAAPTGSHSNDPVGVVSCRVQRVSSQLPPRLARRRGEEPRLTEDVFAVGWQLCSLLTGLLVSGQSCSVSPSPNPDALLLPASGVRCHSSSRGAELTLMRETGKKPTNQTQNLLPRILLLARPPFTLAWSIARIQTR